MNSNKNKPSKVKVTKANSVTTDFFDDILKELSTILQFDFDFISDIASIEMFLLKDSPALLKRHTKFYCEALEKTFGVPFTEQHLSEEFGDLIPWIAKNRTTQSSTSPVPVVPFLGIKSIIDDKQDQLSLFQCFGNKSQLDYWIGMLLGKTDDSSRKMREDIKPDYDYFMQTVYGTSLRQHYLITTIEGDSILCKNILEVCLWSEARANNYKAQGTKGNW